MFNVSKIIICYVDDATAIVSYKDIKILRKHIDQYYLLIEAYYKINHLQLNADKTKFMIICPPKMRESAKDIVVQSGNYIIEESDSIKNLEIYYTNSLNNTKI